MTILLSSFEGGGSMMMPIYTIPEKTGLWIRAGLNTFSSNLANFYSLGVEVDNTLIGYETATLSNTTGTERQVVVDTGTGKSGVLTTVLLPAITSAGTQTIYITIDGVEKSFTPSVSPTSTNNRVVFGDYLPWRAGTSASDSLNYGADGNEGWGDLAQKSFYMLNPNDSLTRGLPVGMIFKDSLKIEIQTTGAFEVGSATNKAVASWLTAIPEGL
jgi:hypothetical protein